MSISSLTDQFRQSSLPIKVGVITLLALWGLAIVGFAGAAILLFEQPSQAAQPAPQQTGPAITLAPPAGSAGSSVTVTGEGWNPGAMVLIYMSPAESTYAVASAAVDGAGRFTTNFVVPTDGRWQNAGTATVIARTDDNLVSAQAVLNIVASSTLPTETPVTASTATPTPTATSSIPTATPQPGAPLATTNTDLNVRGGPGVGYPILGLIRAGQTAEITGLSADAGWWQIRFPGVPGERGWLAGQYVTARNSSNVPVVQAPPLPPTATPVPPTPTRVAPTATPIVFTDWRAEYYNNASLSGGPALVRNDVAINFNWGSGSPAAGISADNFSARWSRSLNLPAGLYRIYLNVDDGVRVWVDGSLLIDQWRDSSPTSYTADIRLSDGLHNFRIEYYDRSGGALIDLRWQRQSDSNQAPQAIPGGPYTISEGSSLTLDGSRSYDPDGRVDRLEWDFNYDGRNFDRDASGKYPQISYPDGPATLTIALRATDERGASQIVTTRVTVQNVSPWVEAGGPYSGLAGGAINLNGSASDGGSTDQASLVYRWDFGDGTSANGAAVSHSYGQAGTYTARLTVTDKDGGQSVDTATVQVGANNRAPVAVISGPTSGKAGESLTFSGANSSDSDGSIVSYSWNFGDGATASGAQVSHTYGQAGSYQVSLTVTDNSGQSASSAVLVSIGEVVKLPPTAKIQGPTSGLVGQAVNFSGAASSDSDGSITRYSWDFGDGTTAKGVDVSHTYNTYGTYQVTLTVTDNDGLTGQTSLSLLIDEIIQVEQPPTAALVGPNSGFTGQPITLDGSGSKDIDGSIVSYAWSYGDGLSDTGMLPTVTHTFTTTGAFTVTLTVTDDMGMTDSDALPIIIN